MQAKRQPGPFSETVPPHDLEAEISVLGACLLDADVIPDALHRLRRDDFYSPKHGMIFEAIGRLHSKKEPVDLITVQNELKQAGVLDQVGGLHYLTQMVGQVPTTGNTGAYVRIVAEASSKRALILAARKIVDLAHSDISFDELRVASVGHINDAVFHNGSSEVRLLGQDLYQFVEKAYEDWKEKRAEASIVWTGFSHQDLVMPLVKGETTIVAAASSMGKTTYKNALEANVARRKQKVLAFSLEMSRRQILQKAWARAARINSLAIRKLGLSEEQWSRSFEAVARQVDLPLYYVSRPRMSFSDMKLVAVAFKAKYGGLDLITVDYWQIIGDQPRRDERPDRMLGRLVEDAKALAVELDCHVLILAQAKIDSFKVLPSLEDVKESRDIVAAADNVLFLTRPSKYGDLPITVPVEGGTVTIKCNICGYDGKPVFQNVMIGSQGKQRMGPEDLVLYMADMSTGTIGDLAKPYPWDTMEHHKEREERENGGRSTGKGDRRGRTT